MKLKGLDKYYNSLTLKIKQFVSECNVENYFKRPKDWFDSLNTIEKNLFRFHIMLNPKNSKFIFDAGFPYDWSGTMCIGLLYGTMDKNCFDEFGYYDEDLIEMFYSKKISFEYYVDCLRRNKPIKILNDYGVSCLSSDDEVKAWRYYTSETKENFEYCFYQLEQTDK